MEYMGIIGFVFGIFGMLAYMEVSSLKRRVERLEEQLAATEGTEQYVARQAFVQAAKSYIGMKVKIDLKEDHEDFDIINYGNSKHGSNTILDADEDWLLVHIESPKGNKDKLIRAGSIKHIEVVE
ncbi:MAG: hypothetical protein II627_01795 [Lachnospiraceae bacterium]|nr:hypothetical protein [Lachnospiraceae bacterium]